MFTKLSQRSTSWWVCVMMTSALSACVLTVFVYTVHAVDNQAAVMSGTSDCFTWSASAKVDSFTQQSGCTYKATSSHSISVTSRRNANQGINWSYGLTVNKSNKPGNPIACQQPSGNPVLDPPDGTQYSQQVGPFANYSHSNTLSGTWNLTPGVANCIYDVFAYTNLTECGVNHDPHDPESETVPLCN